MVVFLAIMEKKHPNPPIKYSKMIVLLNGFQPVGGLSRQGQLKLEKTAMAICNISVVPLIMVEKNLAR